MKANVLELNKLLKFSLLTLTTICVATSAIAQTKNVQGSKAGGGGGVYRTADGQLITLPEFGILIGETKTEEKKYERYYTISEETKKEVRKIVGKLDQIMPGHRLTVERIIGTRSTYVIQPNVDYAKYAQIKEDYKKVLNAFKYKFEDDKFVLPAYSALSQQAHEMRTYILPDFDQLTPIRQARILAHESIMRLNNVLLRYRHGDIEYEPNIAPERWLQNALAIDTLIYDMMNKQKISEVKILPILKLFAKTGLIHFSYLANAVLLKMQRELKRPVLLEELFVDKVLGTSFDIRHKMDPSLIQSLQEKNNLSENYAEALEDGQFERGGGNFILALPPHENLGRSYQIQAFCERFRTRAAYMPMVQIAVKNLSETQHVAFLVDCFGLPLSHDNSPWVSIYSPLPYFYR